MWVTDSKVIHSKKLLPINRAHYVLPTSSNLVSPGRPIHGGTSSLRTRRATEPSVSKGSDSIHVTINNAKNAFVCSFPISMLIYGSQLDVCHAVTSWILVTPVFVGRYCRKQSLLITHTFERRRPLWFVMPDRRTVQLWRSTSENYSWINRYTKHNQVHGGGLFPYFVHVAKFGHFSGFLRITDQKMAISYS